MRSFYSSNHSWVCGLSIVDVFLVSHGFSYIILNGSSLLVRGEHHVLLSHSLCKFSLSNLLSSCILAFLNKQIIALNSFSSITSLFTFVSSLFPVIEIVNIIVILLLDLFLLFFMTIDLNSSVLMDLLHSCLLCLHCIICLLCFFVLFLMKLVSKLNQDKCSF